MKVKYLGTAVSPLTPTFSPGGRVRGVEAARFS
jgi:hypothetical protein